MMSLKYLGYGIINKTIAPIRTKPNAESSLADEALLGMVVKLITLENNEWYYIETHYKYRGYIYIDDLIIDNDKVVLWKKEADKLIIHSIVDVMKEPNYQNYVIKLLAKGSILQSTQHKKDGWIEVILPDLKKGWIKEKYIQRKKSFDLRKDEEVIREDVVKTAFSYLGTQYRWGGKSPLGIDCSGLCFMAYMINGITIWRDAELKSDYMREIKREEMKKGDLMFYKGHVAMYIGDGKAIHSASSKSGVVIDSLGENDENYNEYLDKNIISIGSIF